MFNSNPFQQILKALPQGYFNTIVDKLDADRYDKSFKSYQHLVALIFAQMAGVNSLRELETAFNAQESAHYHLGMSPIKRSTLSEANQRRNPEVFKAVVDKLISQVSKRQRHAIQPLIGLLDSTPIQLKSRGHEWTQATSTYRQTGLKVHILIDGYQHTPSYVSVTDANVGDTTDAANIVWQPNTTYVFDKGYYHYNLWHRIHTKGAFFVTRFKHNAAIDSVQSLPIEEASILADEIVCLRNKSNRAKHKNAYYGTPLRKVTVYRKGKTPMVLATNLTDASAEHIAALYKQRWDIELFFKWLKQHLKIKKFLGESRRAVVLQIYAAIITYLLIWIARNAQGATISLYLFMVKLRTTLFQRSETHYHYKKRRQRNHRIEFMEERQYAMAF